MTSPVAKPKQAIPQTSYQQSKNTFEEDKKIQPKESLENEFTSEHEVKEEIEPKTSSNDTPKPQEEEFDENDLC